MKLLYITANPKLETDSACKTCARTLLNKCIEQSPDLIVEELNLYEENIPEVDFEIYTGRGELKSGADYDRLNDDKKSKIDRVNFLCEQFLSADKYIIAAPMWSLLFPARLNSYIDCIILHNKIIDISPQMVKGLLDDKDRRMIYVQSSGGKYTNLITSRLDYGTDYLNLLFRFLGVKSFQPLPVEGTGCSDAEKDEALMKANEEIETLLPMFMK